MSDKPKAFGQRAHALSPAAPEDGLDKTDPHLDRLWAMEAKDRLTAYRRGELAVKGLNEIVAKYRS